MTPNFSWSTMIHEFCTFGEVIEEYCFVQGKMNAINTVKTNYSSAHQVVLPVGILRSTAKSGPEVLLSPPLQIGQVPHSIQVPFVESFLQNFRPFLLGTYTYMAFPSAETLYSFAIFTLRSQLKWTLPRPQLTILFRSPETRKN